MDDQQPQSASAPTPAAPDVQSAQAAGDAALRDIAGLHGISEELLARSLGYTEVVADATPLEKPEVIVIFGNPAPQQQVKRYDGEGNEIGQISVPHPYVKQSVTRVEHWPGFHDPERVEHTLSTNNDRVLTLIARNLKDEHRRYAVGINEMEQIVAVHTGGVSPSWVVSNDPEYAKVLGEHFGCPVGEPVALLTTAGRDALHAQTMSTSAQPASFNYMAITADSATPLVGDTTLASEQTTNGLGRAQATYAHTATTNTTTLTKTFTYTGSGAVTLAKIGILNAASTGTLGYETLLNATATVTTNGDNVTVTETVTIA